MIIVNGKIITQGDPNQIWEDKALYVQDGKIIEIGEANELRKKHPETTIVNARSQYILPGNICAHTHFYGAFSRGMGIPGEAPDAFPAILDKLWWRLDKALSMEDVRYSALVCIINAIRHGTTTLFDHHASPNAIDGSLDVIADVVEQAGIRASLCYEVTDRDGIERRDAGIRENMRFLKRLKSNNLNGRLAGSFGLHASLTISEESIVKCAESISEGVGFHIHVAEHSVDEYDSLQKCGLRVVDRLKKHNILGNQTIVSHAVHVDGVEMQLLADTQTWVTHQPRSNMNNAVGMAEVESMLRSGISVCLGNDGFSNAMWEEWKAAYLVHKLHHRDPRRMGGYTVTDLAVKNNAKMASHFFGREIGTIKPGAQADLIFVDYHPFTELTAGNLPWHILFGFNESMITSTMVDGKFLMYDRELLTLDEEKIASEALKLSSETWKRYQNMF